MTTPPAHDFAEDARAENTRRAYASDWRAFEAWCNAEGATALPAAPATVATYLRAKAGGLAVSTLGRRLAAIRAYHLDGSHTPPASAELHLVWKGVRRRFGRPPRQKRPLTAEDLRRGLAKLSPTPTGDRQRAMLLIGYAAALRRSELAALELDGPDRAGTVWLEFVPEGLLVYLDRSKGDQEGKGAVVGIPFGQTELCPVSALQRWLAAAGISAGPVFRPIDRWGRIGPRALSAGSVATEVKAAATAAGLNPDFFSGHSLRAGLITDAFMAEVDLETIMRTSRHKRFETLRGYIRTAERFKRNAAARVGL